MAIQSVDKLVSVKAFAMANPLPLDAREVYESLSAAHVYAASNPTAYAGQTVKVVENGKVAAYMLCPSTKSGENFSLQLIASDSDGVSNIATSTVEGNIEVTTPNGETTEVKNIPVVGTLVNPVVDEDRHILTVTKVGATAEQNADIVVPLGGASPDTIVSEIAVSEEAHAVKVTKFDVATETSSTESVKIHGVVTGIDTDTAGIIEVTKPTADGTNQAEKLAMVGTVINATYDAETNVLNLPVVAAVENDEVKTTDVTIDFGTITSGASVGAFTDVTQTADAETKSAKMEFSYTDEVGATQKKEVFESGVRKVEAGTSLDKIKVTVAGVDGTYTMSEILVGAGSVKNPTYDTETRTITLPVLQADGTTRDTVINLGKDLVVKSGSYNKTSQEIELVLTDDSIIKVPVAHLVDIYTGATTATVTTTVSENNEITSVVNVSATATNNVLKAAEDGLYVSEDDFTVTKKAIEDAVTSANTYSDGKLTEKATELDAAISKALEDAKTYADTKTAEASIDFVDFGAEAE